MDAWMFWLGVVAAVALLLLGARLYDRRYRNRKGMPGAGLSEGAVQDQEMARWTGTYRNAP
jgi:hypothetical protein